MAGRFTWTSWHKPVLADPGRWLYPAGLVLFSLLFFARPLVHGGISAPVDVIVANYPWNQQPAYTKIANQGVEIGLTDVPDQLLPSYFFVRDELRHGRMPLWYPFAQGGEPFFATDIPAALYPLNLLSLLMPLLVALQFLVMIKPLLASFGMYAYLRALGLHRPAAFVGAIAFAYCSYIVIWLDFPQAAVAGWLPWTMLGIEGLLQSRRRPLVWVAALAGVTGMQLLGGHIETSLHILLFAGIYALARAAGTLLTNRHREQQRVVVLRLACCGVGVALGVALAAVQLVPTAQYVLGSYTATFRAHEPPARLPLADLSSWLVPNLNGSPAYGRFHLWDHPFDYTQEIAYSGIATGVLACVALFKRRRSTTQYVWPLLLVLTIAAGLAYGVQPIFALVRLPFLRTADNIRVTLLMSFSIAGLAAIGVDGLFEEVSARSAAERTRGIIRKYGVPFASLGATSVFFALAAATNKARIIHVIRYIGHRPEQPSLSLWNQVWTIFAIVVALAAVLLVYCVRTHKLGVRAGGLALALLVAGDLFAFGVPLNWSYNPNLLFPPDPLIDATRSLADGGRLALPSEPLHQGFLLPYEIRSPGASIENVFLPRVADLMARVNRFGPNPDYELEVETNLVPDRHLLALENATLLLLRTNEVEFPEAGGRLVVQQEAERDQPLLVLQPGDEVSQAFPANATALSALAVFVATDGPSSGEQLAVGVTDDLTGVLLATAEVPIPAATTGVWLIARLPPTTVQHEQRLRVALSRPGTDSAARSITLFGTPRPLLDGATAMHNGQAAAAALRLRAYAPSDADSLTPVWHDSVTTLYRVADARPRVYVADGVLSASGGVAALAALDRLHVPGADAVVESAGPLVSSGGQASIVQEHAGDIAVHVTAPSPGVLVLTEGYGDGGWEVSVDGKHEPVLRANYLYQGVTVGAGDHIVHFRYRPRAFYGGAALSAAAGIAVIGLLTWPYVRRARRRA